MNIPENHNYRVRVELPKFDFFSDVSLEVHSNDVKRMREWLDELVDWQPDMYSIGFFSQGAFANVWFKEKEHAMLFKLGWA
jgi:hypothetical protein